MLNIDYKVVLKVLGRKLKKALPGYPLEKLYMIVRDLKANQKRILIKLKSRKSKTSQLHLSLKKFLTL